MCSYNHKLICISFFFTDIFKYTKKNRVREAKKEKDR